MRRRYREPVAIAFAVALIASLSVHLPVYDVLGNLADRLKAEAEEARKNRKLDPVEVEFDVPETGKSQRARKRTPKKRQQAKRQRQAKQQQQQAQAQATPKQQPKPQQPRLDAPQAVQQHSTNPEVAPDNPRFVAEQNNKVEEESVARVRNMIRDDQTPSPGQQQKRANTLEEAGNSSEQKVAEMRNKQGSDAREPTPAEARRKRPDKAINADPIKAQQVSSKSTPGKQAQTSGDRSNEAADTITITDAAGTFSIRRPSKASQGGGHTSKGRGPGGKLSWSQFEAAVGSERLEQDRRAYLAEQKSSQQGIAREKTWNEFRAAIENYVPGVKPGATTALNAAASPFATYIAAVHRRIHQEFADGFLRSLPIGGSPYQDPTLMTKLEIVLNRDGSVHRVGIVRSSGLLPFDFGAFNSVLRGQPYPPAPSSILSGDGRVYFHWGFYRNQRQCGTFNAEPYIVPNPRGAPSRGPTDAPDWNTVVPQGSQPTWNTRGNESREEDEPKGPPEESQPAQPREKEEEAPGAAPPPPGSGLG